MKQIEETWPQDVRVVFKNKPLSFHPHAKPAALAAVAAHWQGKFWEMHDKLFGNQQKLDDADLEGYAKVLGLDVAKWKADLASPKTEDMIKKSDAMCEKNGASGTPAFFVNGRYMSGAKPFEEFKVVIEEELKKAKAELAKGVSREKYYEHVLKMARSVPGGALEVGVHRFDLTQAPSQGPNNAVATLLIYSDFQ